MKMIFYSSIIIFLSTLLFSFYSNSTNSNILKDKIEIYIPNGFPSPLIPKDNELSKSRIELGKILFYDKILSLDSSISCGSCHAPANSFTDKKQFSTGVNNKTGDRNSMPLINLAWSNSFMWDGGVASLELQIMNPLTNHKEMNMQVSEVIDRLNNNTLYLKLFKKAYKCKPDAASLFKAIASFERTLISANSRYDKFFYAKDQTVMNDSELRGYFIFNSEKTHCASCHTGFNFTNNTFQNNGLYSEYKDEGRYRITHDENDKGKFKVPTLRNIAFTAPYMHDGSLKTLEEVINHYNSGGKNHPNQSAHIHRHEGEVLLEREKRDLINFLKALSDEDFINNLEFNP